MSQVPIPPGSIPSGSGSKPTITHFSSGQSTGAASGSAGAPPVTRSASGGSVAPSAGAIEAAATAGVTMNSKIKAFSQSMGAGHHQEAWKRPTNVTGTGATHVRSFHCRMATEGLEFLDKQINEWLDAHPDYEVKNVTIAVGEWSGKIKEANLIVQVWV